MAFETDPIPEPHVSPESLATELLACALEHRASQLALSEELDCHLEKSSEKTHLLSAWSSQPTPPPTQAPLDPERQSPHPTPFYRRPHLHHSLATALYILNFLAQLTYSTLFRASYRPTDDPTTPAWVFGVNVDYYFLFEMLVLCSLQGVWAVDDLVVGQETAEVEEREGSGTGRVFGKMMRVWVMLGVSFVPWVGAGLAVLDACAGRRECGRGVFGPVVGWLFGPGWGR